MKTLQVEISGAAYNKLKNEVTFRRLFCTQYNGVLDGFAIELFKAWDNNEVPVIKFKSE